MPISIVRLSWALIYRNANIEHSHIWCAASSGRTEVSHWNSCDIIYAPSSTKSLSACVCMSVWQRQSGERKFSRRDYYFCCAKQKNELKVKRNSVHRSVTLRRRSHLPSHTDIPCSTFCCFRDYIAIVCFSGMLFGACNNKRMCARARDACANEHHDAATAK